MKCGTKKMMKGGVAKAMKAPGATRRTMAQEKALPMKKGGEVRGMGAATKGAGKGPWC